jgi:uncharacterized protein (TIGR02466 family)
MNVEAIFPTLIGYCDNVLSDDENKILLDNCYDVEKKFSGNLQKGWLSGENSPYTTHGSHNLLGDENFKSFISKVTDHVHEYAKLCGDMNDYTCSTGWLNIYRNNNYQEPHIHEYNMYSAVYFVAAPEGSGNIVFVNPTTYVLTNDIPAESPTWSYKPREKMLLIFKSSLIHYVLHSTCNKDRISIALNYFFSVEQYKKLFNVHDGH